MLGHVVDLALDQGMSCFHIFRSLADSRPFHPSLPQVILGFPTSKNEHAPISSRISARTGPDKFADLVVHIAPLLQTLRSDGAGLSAPPLAVAPRLLSASPPSTGGAARGTFRVPHAVAALFRDSVVPATCGRARVSTRSSKMALRRLRVLDVSPPDRVFHPLTYLVSSTSVVAMDNKTAFRILQSRWAVVAVIVVTSYDYLLTLDREVQYVWRKTTSASAIYIAIRYSCLASNILTLLTFFPFPGKSTPKYAPICASAHTLISYGLAGVAYFAILLVCNVINLVFINTVEVLLDLIGAMSAHVFLTFLFVSSADDFPVQRDGVSTMHSVLAFRSIDGLSTASHSQGFFAADITWRSAEDSESVCSTRHGDGYELQANPGRGE
ncbi:uncharacterized protein BXZ73DRAFT_98050 [Epithele typhae]|uniref:uncharacterized protein n=1 Tax=Epithele typhae TaxID=378194 RepID=UPI002007C750|nr:uncharacterized protein BXZ73DRAFT_98050 [Epithele typhae]KAH9941663.1 hypothetical protein BXZ73DRAFT_98050 [Epithele typhae]